jgi:hypothetical protein
VGVLPGGDCGSGIGAWGEVHVIRVGTAKLP